MGHRQSLTRPGAQPFCIKARASLGSGRSSAARSSSALVEEGEQPPAPGDDAGGLVEPGNDWRQVKPARRSGMWPGLVVPHLYILWGGRRHLKSQMQSTAGQALCSVMQSKAERCTRTHSSAHAHHVLQAMPHHFTYLTPARGRSRKAGEMETSWAQTLRHACMAWWLPQLMHIATAADQKLASRASTYGGCSQLQGPWLPCCAPGSHPPR